MKPKLPSRFDFIACFFCIIGGMIRACQTSFVLLYGILFLYSTLFFPFLFCTLFCTQYAKSPARGLSFYMYCPVMLAGFLRTVSGVPQATRRPPSVPPPGPMSRIQSAAQMTSRSCSMTTLDDDDRRALIEKSLEDGEQGRHVEGMEADGGFVKDEDRVWGRPISLASLRRCASPPERLGVSSPSVR